MLSSKDRSRTFAKGFIRKSKVIIEDEGEGLASKRFNSKGKARKSRDEKRKSSKMSVFQGILDRRFNHHNTNRSFKDLGIFKNNPDMLSRKSEDGRRRSISPIFNGPSLLRGVNGEFAQKE